jgi:hypothetical protein
VADTPARSVLRCIVSGGVRHYTALVVSRAGVDLSHPLSHVSAPLSLTACTVYHGAEPSRTINWIQKKKKKKIAVMSVRVHLGVKDLGFGDQVVRREGMRKRLSVIW